jgi:hypothetical protein
LMLYLPREDINIIDITNSLWMQLKPQKIQRYKLSKKLLKKKQKKLPSSNWSKKRK